MTMKTTRGLNETTDKLVLIAEKQRVGTPGVKSTFIDADIHSMLMQIKGGTPAYRLHGCCEKWYCSPLIT